MREGSDAEAWERCQGIAFVDDGSRVALLALHGAAVRQPFIVRGPARLIWHALEGGGSPRQIAKYIMGGDAEPDERIATETQEFLKQLEELGLAQLRTDAPSATADPQQG